MFCSRMGNGIPITCTTTYQKWTGQPIHLAGSKNPLPLGMGSVKESESKEWVIEPSELAHLKNELLLPNVAVKPLALAMGEIRFPVLINGKSRRIAIRTSITDNQKLIFANAKLCICY